MKLGLQEITETKDSKGRPLYGMPSIHLQAFQQSAAEMGSAIMVRNVNPSSTPYILAGYYSKGFHAKMKSSKTFPGGLIEAVESKDLEQALSHGYKKIPLVMTRDIFENYIVQSPLILKERKGNEIPFAWEEENSKGEKIIRQAVAKTHGDRYEIFFPDGKPFEILAEGPSEEETLPVTADYDLFAILPTMNLLSPRHTDKSPIHTQGLEAQLKDRLIQAEGSSNPKDKEDPHRGNVSERIKEGIKIINKNITLAEAKSSAAQKTKPKRDGHNPMVHHNTEVTNPFASELVKDLPILMVFPKPINLAELSHQQTVTEILIETKEEAIAVYQKMWEIGFYWPQNAKIPEFNHIDEVRKQVLASGDFKATEQVARLSPDISKRVAQAVKKRLDEEKVPKLKTTQDVKTTEAQIRSNLQKQGRRSGYVFGISEERGGFIDFKKVEERAAEQDHETPSPSSPILLRSTPSTVSPEEETTRPISPSLSGSVTTSPEEEDKKTKNTDLLAAPQSPSILSIPSSGSTLSLFSEEDSESSISPISPKTISPESHPKIASPSLATHKKSKSRWTTMFKSKELPVEVMQIAQHLGVDVKNVPDTIKRRITKLQDILDKKDFSAKGNESYRKLLNYISEDLQKSSQRYLKPFYDKLAKKYEVIQTTSYQQARTLKVTVNKKGDG